MLLPPKLCSAIANSLSLRWCDIFLCPFRFRFPRHKLNKDRIGYKEQNRSMQILSTAAEPKFYGAKWAMLQKPCPERDSQTWGLYSPLHYFSDQHRLSERSQEKPVVLLHGREKPRGGI